MVNKATPIITWPNPAPITLGIPLSATQLNATASVSGVSLAGTFVYNPPLKTILGAGTQTLSVTFTPTDTTDYQTVTASVSITVSVTGNLTVQSGQTVTFNNGSISGNVTLSGGTRALNGGTVGGNLTMSSGTLTVGGNSTIGNSVQIQGGTFSIGQASIKGSLQITNVPVTSAWTESTLSSSSQPTLAASPFASDVIIGADMSFLVVDVTQLVQDRLEGPSNGGSARLAQMARTAMCSLSGENRSTAGLPSVPLTALRGTGPRPGL